MSLIRSLSAWKSVNYETDTTAQDNEFQYLAAFEELGDYELVKKGSGNQKNKKPQKRKREQTESDDSQPATANTRPSSSKKKKKIVKRQMLERDSNSDTVGGSDSLTPSALQQPEDDSSDVDMSAWENLFIPEPVLRALRDLRFIQPTEIQNLTMPPAIRDRLDILGAAETGSGKTLAFGIPIIAGLLALKSKSTEESDSAVGPKALILSPTRELALQIKEHLNAVLKYTDIRVACIVGGLSIQKQQRLLKKRPEILMATPGRLWALIQEDFEFVNVLYQTVHYLAIDETDRMVEKGHFMELSSILDFLKKDAMTTQKRQTFVFSATLTYVHPAPKRLTTAKQMKQMTPQDKINLIVSLTGLRKQRKVIDVTHRFGTAEGLTETRLNCSGLLEKDTYLYYFLTNFSGRTLIFTNSIDCARRLRALLTHLNLDPLILHAQMHQKQRLKNLERFSVKEASVLLATDVASRGLDIKNIEHVIHYQVPRTPEIYVHRSGRTARANCQGLSVMLVDQKDVGHYRRICRNLNRDKDLDIFPLDPKAVSMAKERVQLATQLESLEHRTKRDQAKEKWFERVAREAELDDDEDDRRLSSRQSDDKTSESRQEIQRLQRRLNSLLNISAKKRAPVTKYPTAYQFDVSSSTATGNSDNTKAAIAAVSEAREQGKRLVKRLGAKKAAKVARKGKKRKVDTVTR